jgi:hypothetical protein
VKAKQPKIEIDDICSGSRSMLMVCNCPGDSSPSAHPFATAYVIDLPAQQGAVERYASPSMPSVRTLRFLIVAACHCFVAVLQQKHES